MRPSPTRVYTRETEFAEMVRDHQAAIWRYLRFLGCEGVLAEDLVQETFLAVWRKPFEDRGPEATAAYLRRVARNLFLMAVRRKKARPAFRELRDADRAWQAHAADDEGTAYRSALAQCVERLKERPRRALDLFYRARSSRDEIAAALDMTANGVKTLMRRTRDALKECIQRRLQR